MAPSFLPLFPEEESFRFLNLALFPGKQIWFSR
jgi:hypothetical protein